MSRISTASRYQPTIKAKANQVKNKIKTSRRFVKVRIRPSDIGKTISNDFLTGINKLAGLKWHVLNNLQLLDSVGFAYRNSSYDTIAKTRQFLKENWGIPLGKTLVGDENYKPYNYQNLQVLGSHKNLKSKSFNTSKINKDRYLFTIDKTNLSGANGSFRISTNVNIDDYIDINYISKQYINYVGGTQGKAGVIIGGKLFVRNVFPITFKNGNVLYMFRLKTSPNSPINWVSVEQLKAKGIYKADTTVANSYYESEQRLLGGAFESKLSSYGYAKVGEEFKKIFDRYSGKALANSFLDTFEASLNKKIKKVMIGNAIAYNIAKSKGK